MQNKFISILSELFSAVIAGMFVQNIMLARASGLDRTRQMGEDSDERIFLMLQFFCSLVSSILFWLIHRYLLPLIDLSGLFGLPEYYSRAFLWPVIMAVVLSAVFMITFVMVVKLAPYEYVTSAARQLPFAAFNNFLVCVIFVGISNNYGLGRFLAYTFGSNIGYVLANIAIREGNRKIQNKEIPAAFRGLPATILYLSGLAMAVYAMSGHDLSSLM